MLAVRVARSDANVPDVYGTATSRAAATGLWHGGKWVFSSGSEIL